MKKNLRNLLSVLLSLALALSLALPAFAYEDTDPPLWQDYGYTSLEEFLTDFSLTEEEYAQLVQEELDRRASVQAWMDAHPQEIAGFDPYAYYEENYSYWYECSAQDYMAEYGITEEMFRQEMLEEWVMNAIYEEEYAEDLRQQQERVQAWIDNHPQEVTSFDPYAYYEETYNFEGDGSPQSFMEEEGLTEEAFYQQMLFDWANEKLWEEEILQQNQADRQAWIDAHPQEVADFDPYAYYEETYGGWNEAFPTAQSYMEKYQLTEAEFAQEMLSLWVDDRITQEEYEKYLEESNRREQEKRQAWMDAHPQEVADFDPYAYYEQTQAAWMELSAQEYIQEFGLTEEEFYQDMLATMVSNELALEDLRQSLAWEKEMVGGSAEGTNIMVDGTCLSLPDARPIQKDGLTLVPLVPVMESLGANVSYSPEEGVISLALDEQSVYIYHQIGSQDVTVSSVPLDGSASPASQGETFTMEAPSLVQDGRTLVPLSFFSLALGYQTYWDSIYETAVLFDRQSLAQRIDQEFTLFNRMLYTQSGQELLAQNTPLLYQLDLDLAFTPPEETAPYPIHLTGSALVSAEAVNLQLTADLSSLAPLFFEETSSADPALEPLVSAMYSQLEAEFIYNRESETLYVRAPLLAAMGYTEHGDTWIQVEDLDLAQFVTPNVSSVSQLFLQAPTPYQSTFYLYQNATNAASELLAILGDDCFTRSGAVYSAQWDEDSLNSYFIGSEVAFSGSLSVSPVGDKGCSFTAVLSLHDEFSDFDMNWWGSRGECTIELKFNPYGEGLFQLEANRTIAPTTCLPQTLPPEGAPIVSFESILERGSL